MTKHDIAKTALQKKTNYSHTVVFLQGGNNQKNSCSLHRKRKQRYKK